MKEDSYRGEKDPQEQILKYNKLVAFSVCFLLVFSLVGCESQQKKEARVAKEKAEVLTVKKVTSRCATGKMQFF